MSSAEIFNIHAKRSEVYIQDTVQHLYFANKEMIK